MQKFAIGEDKAIPYTLKFDENRFQDPFFVEWINESTTDRNRVNDKIAQLNSIFRKSIEYYPGSLYDSPCWPSRRFLRKEENEVKEIFQIMDEIGVDISMVKAILRSLIVSKFEMSDAIEALMEANYYAWEKIRKIENDDRIFKQNFEQLKYDHDCIKFEIKKLKDNAGIQ